MHEKLSRESEAHNHSSSKRIKLIFDVYLIFGIQDRMKRCHTSSPSSPLRKKAAPGRRQILKRLNSMNALAELPGHEELIVPIQPKKITSSIEVRFTITCVYIQGEILLECQFSLNLEIGPGKLVFSDSCFVHLIFDFHETVLSPTGSCGSNCPITVVVVFVEPINDVVQFLN